MSPNVRAFYLPDQTVITTRTAQSFVPTSWKQPVLTGDVTPFWDLCCFISVKDNDVLFCTIAFICVFNSLFQGKVFH